MPNTGEGLGGTTGTGYYGGETGSESGGTTGGASSFVENARSQVSNAVDRLDLRSQIEQHPLRTLALAAAAGYILGGGLLTRFTLKLVMGGAKLASLPLLRDELSGFLGGSGGSRDQEFEGGET